MIIYSWQIIVFSYSFPIELLVISIEKDPIGYNNTIICHNFIS